MTYSGQNKRTDHRVGISNTKMPYPYNRNPSCSLVQSVRPRIIKNGTRVKQETSIPPYSVESEVGGEGDEETKSLSKRLKKCQSNKRLQNEYVCIYVYITFLIINYTLNVKIHSVDQNIHFPTTAARPQHLTGPPCTCMKQSIH